ncbi:hypothetical protein [Epilithonimonas mollis]|uniref:Uncharacterized protein n=1 Tax=Epilithonimonas mollis TaxID=216903 RepID=A0A1M6UIL0_9FLAO|nr:hypothetical protein [Epilithonimonas mollis]SHK69075.1 hypothetical protein SAMN05444371_3312 [Epilithonimonas mollis]
MQPYTLVTNICDFNDNNKGNKPLYLKKLLIMYELFDNEGKKIEHHDLQDKSHWCKDGEKIEEAFVRLYGEQLNLAINPAKGYDPFAPDLINTLTGRLGDLKHQATPFFKARKLFGIDPTYAVVFNEKDKLRYEEKYPEITIYYWVNWLAVKYRTEWSEITVRPLQGVWKSEFRDFNKYLSTRLLHYYQQRTDDTKGNAKGSFVCDIRNEAFEKLI